MNYEEYLKSELMVLIPVLYVMGIGLKKSKLADKWIPLVLGGTAIVLSATWVLATSDIASLHEAANAVFTAVTQGILAAGASVYVNQLIVQSRKEE